MRFDTLRASIIPSCMRRGFTTFLLIFCVFWQALAHAGAGVVIASQEEQSHAAMHFHSEAHHHDHHDDGTGDIDGVHSDQSDESVQHLAADCGIHAPGLLGFVDMRLTQLPPEMPVEVVATPPPSPFLAGPERPPKSQS